MAHDLKHFLRKTHETLKAFKGKVDALKKDHDEPPHHHHDRPIEKVQKMEITASAATMAKFVVITILLLALSAFLYEIWQILIVFFVSLLFAAALDPLVDALERRRIPRSIGVVMIYLAVLMFLGFFIASLAPILAREVAQLAGRAQDFIVNLAKGNIQLPGFLEWLHPWLQKVFGGLDASKIGNYTDLLLKTANQLSGVATSVAGNVFNAVIVAFNGIFNVILIFILTFLMVVDEHGIDKFILSLFPERHAEYIQEKSKAIKAKMGYWLRGQVILCVVVGSLVYIGFLIIGLFVKDVHYSATISMMAGFTEMIPYAGPLIAWLFALPIVANHSLALVLWMTGLMYIVQVLENNIIVPVIMHKAVGISPIFVIFAGLVGFEFLGILGIILSVPVATAIAIFLKDYSDKEK